MAKGKTRLDVQPGMSAPLRQSLGGLAALRDQLPPGPSHGSTVQPAPVEAASSLSPSPWLRAKKIVVRRERKGHGGKTLTRIEGITGSPQELDAVLRDIKRGLGCGASWDEGHLLVQGDQIDRVRAYVEAQCGKTAKKIIVGN